MSENIFAEVEAEKEEILDTTESTKEEAPQESQTEKQEVKAEPTEEPDLRKSQTWKAMREESERKDKELADISARLAEIEKQKVIDKVEQPAFLTEIVGDNESVARKYLEHEEELKERIKRELIEDQRKESDAKKAEEDRWLKWTEEQFVKVGITDNNTKNELAKVMVEYSPTDDQGNLDYTKGMKILTSLKQATADVETQKVEAKKKIADATLSKETNAKEDKGYLTSNELRNKGWRSFSKI